MDNTELLALARKTREALDAEDAEDEAFQSEYGDGEAEEAIERSLEATEAKGDPYWTTAKADGVDSKGNVYKRGDRIFYYPNGKVTLAGKDAEKASREFDAAVADEGW